MNIFSNREGGLAAFYAAVLATFCLIWATPIQVNWMLSSQEENIVLDRAPAMTQAELRAEAAALHKESEGPAHADPLDYYRFLAKEYRLEAAAHRYTRDHHERDMFVESILLNWGTKDKMQNAYFQRFGHQKMGDLSKEGVALLGPHHPLDRLRTGVSYAPFWSAMGEAYLECILLAIFFLVGRLKQYELNVPIESLHLPVIAMVWPVGIFLYPVRIDPRRQLQRAKQFAAFCFSSLVSFMGMTTTGAYAQSASKTSRSGAHSMQIEMPSLLLTSQVMSKKIIKNGRVPEDGPIVQGDLTATWKNGAFVSLWGQTNFQGHTGVGREEIDGVIGWSGKHFHFSLAYFDVSPALRDSAGNVLSPRIELDMPWKINTEHTVTPFARFEWLQTFRKAAANSGAVSIVGAKHRWQLPCGVSLSQALWGLYDHSVFGSDEGVMGRYQFGLHVPVGHGVTLSPVIVDLSVPLSGIHDRKVETAVGTGISVQLN